MTVRPSASKTATALWSAGLRYRIHTSLPGRPDIVFPRQKVAIFVDGCFWHKCPQHFQWPKTRQEFWKNKIERNVARDQAVTDRLTEAGWRVVRVWEHEIDQHCHNLVDKIRGLLSG